MRSEIGHWSVMVNDLQNALGCAVCQFNTGGAFPFNTYLVCNYSHTNIIGAPIYTAGPDTSQCTTGTNPLYPALCSINEPINPNA